MSISSPVVLIRGRGVGLGFIGLIGFIGLTGFIGFIGFSV